jgi:hypothetical protein
MSNKKTVNKSTKVLLRKSNNVQKVPKVTKKPKNVQTTIVNVKVAELRPVYQNLMEWLKDDSHVYIGRDMSFYVDGAYKSKWHNPYKVAKPRKIYKKGAYNTLEDSLDLYEKYIRNSKLIDEIDELRGKTLGCWCKPNKCHGDILIKILNE